MDIQNKKTNQDPNGNGGKIDSPRTAQDPIPKRINMPSALKTGSTKGMDA